MKKALGKHILAEYNECDLDIINDVKSVERVMILAAQKAGATVISSSFHRFEPYGVSGVVIISESHLAIHTWPEFSYASVDIFTCGESMDPLVSYEFLKLAFKTTNASSQTILRGILS
jgi:S-adenosylmethionine decarboxylase proenzyme